ncbi:MFS transporter [Catenuloplanes japonicus]|uniref:MFS transporter n=1 Tax=Catenuloplanes japonicus TaxID=33876 RepID=UPI00068E177D|nr:MFS transporter [Catenuloplanes japonicus]
MTAVLSRRAEAIATVALAAIAFIVVTGETLPIGLIAEVADGIGATESRVGLTVSWYALIAAASAVPLTRWTSRFDRRQVLLGSAAVFGAGHLVAAFAQDVAVLGAGRGLAALGHGVYFAVAAPAAMRLARPEARGRAGARVMVGGSIALVVGTPLATLLGQVSSWRVAMLAVGVVAVALGVLVARLLPPLSGAEVRGSGGSVLSTVRVPGVLPILGVVLFAVTGHFTLYTYIAPYVGERFGVTGAGLTILLLVYGAAAVVGSTLAGRVADLRPVAGVRVAAATFTIALAGLWAAGSLSIEIAGLPLIVLWGGAFSVLNVCVALAVLRRAPGPRAETANAITGIVFQVGIVTGSALGAAASSAGLLATVPLLTAAGGVLVLTIAMLRGSAFAHAPVTPIEPLDTAAAPRDAEKVGLGLPRV